MSEEKWPLKPVGAEKIGKEKKKVKREKERERAHGVILITAIGSHPPRAEYADLHISNDLFGIFDIVREKERKEKKKPQNLLQ